MEEIYYVFAISQKQLALGASLAAVLLLWATFLPRGGRLK